MASIIKTNGSIEIINPINGSVFSLEELQQYVEGLIQIINLPDNMVIIMNEEGKLLDLLLNPVATELFQKYLLPNDFIVGNVVICTSHQAGYDEIES